MQKKRESKKMRNQLKTTRSGIKAEHERSGRHLKHLPINPLKKTTVMIPVTEIEA